jgi:hypothetical protein
MVKKRAKKDGTLVARIAGRFPVFWAETMQRFQRENELHGLHTIFSFFGPKQCNDERKE